VTYRRREDYRERLGAFTWELPEDLHPDVFVTDLACMWLERYPKKNEEPFFLQVGMPGPHPPYDPTAEYLERYIDKDLPKPIRDYDLDTQVQPMRELRAHHQANDHDAIVQLAEPTDEQLHAQRAHYYANVSMIDRQVGKILDSLEQRGVLDNTLIIFTSDHGDCLNDHGHSQKWTMYEQSVRVPAVVFGAGVKTGVKVDDLVSLFDFGPTILEAAGVTPPEWMEARSLQPYLRGEQDETRDCVFAEHSDDKILDATEYMTMIRRGRWKLVHYVDYEEGQLYDLEEDPGERVNRWSDPACAELKMSLMQDILAWRIRSDKITQGFRREIAGLND
jgi:arylsulfatase A-like enzyme